MKHDPNVSPYLLRQPMSYEQAVRLWAKPRRAHSTTHGPANDDSEAVVRRLRQGKVAISHSGKRAIDDA